MEDEIVYGDPVVNHIDDVNLGEIEDVVPVDPDCVGCGELTPEMPLDPQETPIEGEPAQDIVTIGSFFGTLQESVTIAWRFHLKTRKHHIHVALNDYYCRALSIIDDIIEEYQGINGVCEDVFVNYISAEGKTEVEYLNELKGFVVTNKSILGNFTELDSRVDDLLGLIDSIIYKITAFCEHKVKSFSEFCYEDLNESCKYDRYGERSCDDENDDDYDLNYHEEDEEETIKEEE